MSTNVAVSSSSSAAPPPPRWIDLPEDLTANILQRLGAEEILESAQKVCATWWRVCKNPAMWRVIDLDSRQCAANKFEMICCRAVDRSQGQLAKLRLVYFEGNKLPNYIAQRSSQLRSMTLSNCDPAANALTEAIKKLPNLEELHLFITSTLDPINCETIGISCPMLTSFTYTRCWGLSLEFSCQAVAIGKTMPNLRHLKLSEYFQFGENGLKVILDGCLHLELLHLGGRCYRVLQGDLGKRCFELISDHSEIEWSFREKLSCIY